MYMLDVANDEKTNEYTVAFPNKDKRKKKQEVTIKYWWWRTKKTHNDSSKITKNVLIRQSHCGYPGTWCGTRCNTLSNPKKIYMSIVGFRNTSNYPPTSHECTQSRTMHAQHDTPTTTQQKTRVNSQELKNSFSNK